MSQEQIQVPQGWELKTLEEVCEKISDRDHITPKYTESGIPIISPKDFTSTGINFSNCKFISKDDHKKNSERTDLKNGDILFSRIGTVGKTRLVDFDKEFSILHSIVQIRPDLTKISQKFLYYILQSGRIQKDARIGVQSVGTPDLGIKKIRSFKILLSPLSTQKKIVQKLDHMLGQLQEKKKQILEYKEKREQAISQLSQKTIGGIIINHMRLDNPPKSWKLKTIEECVDIQPGFAQGQKNITDGTIHLRMNNIGRNFQLNFYKVRTINATGEQLNKYKLEKGDVVFNNTNSPELVGKSFIFNDDKICLYSNHLTRCRVKNNLILPEWLLFHIRGKWLRRDFEKICNKWINQAAISSDKLKKIQIPIPSLSEQKQILKILKNASIQFEKIANVTKIIKIRDIENKKLLENIQSSILDTAFSGRLVK